jgi:glycyl-tRNA synthetase beta chain
LHDGYAKSVAQAIEDHYKPRFAGDTLPRDVVGQILALADKLEVLVGLFGIGQQPTGDKDPYALRRQALGVIRLLTTGGLTLSLSRLLQHAQSVFDASALQLTWGESMAQLQAFIGERLSGVFKDAGYSSAQIEAVLSLSFDRLDDVDKRLEAVKQFALMPEASALAAANKRIGNILKKSSLSQDVSVNAALFQEDAERALFDAMAVSLPESKALFERALYAPSLASLAALKVPVDHFFEHVMVNAPQSDLRENRMALLRELFTAMNRVADLSRLA